MRPNHVLADRSRITIGRIAAFKKVAFLWRTPDGVAHNMSTVSSWGPWQRFTRGREEWRSLQRHHRGTFECCENTELRLCLPNGACALSGSHRDGLRDHARAAANGCLLCSGPSAGVALLSMGAQVPQVAVEPVTITRLAQWLGLDGCEAIREFYAEAIRNEDIGFAGTASPQVARRKLESERALVTEMVESLTNQIARRSAVRERLVAAAAPPVFARCVNCLALRTCHAIAPPSPDILSPSGDGDIPPDAITAGGRGWIRCACLKDLLFAVDVEPFTRTASKTAPATKRGISIVATDRVVSSRPPLARQVPTDGPSFFYNLPPTFAAIAAVFVGETSLAALQCMQAQRAAFRVHRSQAPRAVRCRGLP